MARGNPDGDSEQECRQRVIANDCHAENKSVAQPQQNAANGRSRFFNPRCSQRKEGGRKYPSAQHSRRHARSDKTASSEYAEKRREEIDLIGRLKMEEVTERDQAFARQLSGCDVLCLVVIDGRDDSQKRERGSQKA